jgi:hypothetical protein
MRFTQWVLDQEDDDTVVGSFQKILFDDINNGCSSSKFDALAWKQHFEVKHADSAEKLISVLAEAYYQYVLRHGKK